MYYHTMWDSYCPGLFGIGGWSSLLFWGLLLFIVFAGARMLIVLWRRSERDPSAASSAALEILKERYAKGEIAKAEFEEKKKDLSV